MVDSENYCVVSKVLGFQKFDVDSHTGTNIRNWTLKVLARFGLATSDCIIFTMDGAANNKTAFEGDNSSLETQVCVAHGLQCCTKVAVGETGAATKDTADAKHFQLGRSNRVKAET